MADSLKLRILKSLTLQLANVLVSDGGAPVGPNVYRGRAQFGDETPLPALNILESPKPDIAITAAENGIVHREDWLLFVQGWIHATDPNQPCDDAYNFMACTELELSKIIAVDKNSGEPQYPGVYLIDNLIAGLSIGPGVCRPPQEGVSASSFFYLPVNVTLTTDCSKPFN